MHSALRTLLTLLTLPSMRPPAAAQENLWPAENHAAFLQQASQPTLPLVRGGDGSFYGITTSGGSGLNGGGGVIFRLSPQGSLTKLCDLYDPVLQISGSNALAPLIAGPDGNFYGTTSNGGQHGTGGIFRVTSQGEFALLKSFPALTGPGFSTNVGGAHPAGRLAFDGNFLIGTAREGGAAGQGTLFSLPVLPTVGGLVTLVDFDFTKGSYPEGGVLRIAEGIYLGLCTRGGDYAAGTAWRYQEPGTFTKFFDFDGPQHGAAPHGEFIPWGDGSYAASARSGGGSNLGTVFRLTTSGLYIGVIPFDGTDGATPSALSPIPGGIIGTTRSGGAHNAGTVFRVTAATPPETLHHFTAAGVREPWAPPVEGGDGQYYGLTKYGGTHGEGSAFRLTASGSLTELASFTGSPGQTPSGEPVFGPDGALYGVAIGLKINQTIHRAPTIYRIPPGGGEPRALARFDAATSGGSPQSSLVLAPDGFLYGTAMEDGANGGGTLYRCSLTGVLSAVHSFTAPANDGTGTAGAQPQGRMESLPDGSLLGTTVVGGIHGKGTIWRWTPPGSFITLRHFNGSDGENPATGLRRGSDGGFYGVTTGGGTAGYGVVFRITSTGQFEKLHDFTGASVLAWPTGSPVLAPDGILYGVAGPRVPDQSAGGIYTLNPDGTGFAAKCLFPGRSDFGPSGWALAGLTSGSDGRLYGLATRGGSGGNGTLFKLQAGGSDFLVLHHFDGMVSGRGPAPPVIGPDGDFYGVSYFGGSEGSGSVWRLRKGIAIRSLTRDAGGAHLALLNVLGTGRVKIEASPSLQSWQALGTVTATDIEPFVFTEPNAPLPSRFYRASMAP